jgi:hypothetical protein
MKIFLWEVHTVASSKTRDRDFKYIPDRKKITWKSQEKSQITENVILRKEERQAATSGWESMLGQLLYIYVGDGSGQEQG